MSLADPFLQKLRPYFKNKISVAFFLSLILHLIFIGSAMVFNQHSQLLYSNNGPLQSIQTVISLDHFQIKGNLKKSKTHLSNISSKQTSLKNILSTQVAKTTSLESNQELSGNSEDSNTLSLLGEVSSGISSNSLLIPESIYLQKIKHFLEKNKRYPTVSKNKKSIGKIIITFTIMSSGEIKNTKFETQINDQDLIEEAKRLIKKLNFLYPFPKDIKRSS